MITFASAFYILKSKFSKNKYEKWFSNFLTNVKNFNLVVFCDIESKKLLEKYTNNNDNIKLVILNIENFYNYKYKDFWIKNHKKNTLLNCNSKKAGMSSHDTTWKLNMLWSEKISFVKNIVENNYFPETDWYGWCDIGYFRGESRGDIPPNMIQKWPNKNKINILKKDKIYYALVRNDPLYLKKLYFIINNKNDLGLPNTPIPPDQWSIAGGFFLLSKEKINVWHKTYDDKLYLYFKNNYLVKDDQIIIIDNIMSNVNDFELVRENKGTDPWFVFQRFLL